MQIQLVCYFSFFVQSTLKVNITQVSAKFQNAIEDFGIDPKIQHVLGNWQLNYFLRIHNSVDDCNMGSSCNYLKKCSQVP